MASISAAQNGNWHDTTTWTGGVVPGSGDVATIGALTVTIVAGHPVTVGDGVAEGVVLSSASSVLNVKDSLTAIGGIKVAGSSTINFDATSGPFTVTLKNSATFVANVTPTGSNPVLNCNTIGQTNLVTFAADASAGGTAAKFNLTGFSGVTNFNYFVFDGLGTSAGKCFDITAGGNSVSFAHGLFRASGQVNIVSSSATQSVALQYCMFLNPINTSGCLSLTNSSTMTGGNRLIQYTAFMGSNVNSATEYSLVGDIKDLTVDHCFVNQCYIRSVTSNAVRHTYSYVMWAGTSGTDSNIALNIIGEGGTVVSNCAFTRYTTDVNKNPHSIQMGGTASGSRNVIQNCIMDGMGTGNSGDFVLPQGAHTLQNCILAGDFGNTNNSSGDAGIILNNTFVNNTQTGISNAGSIVLQEGGPATSTKISAVRNNIFYNVRQGVCMGTGSWMEQAGMSLDYNCASGLTGTDLYVNPNGGGSSYLLRPFLSRVTGTISSSADSTHVTIPDVTGVLVGDVFNCGSGYALVTAVNAGTNTLTLGQRFNASLGTAGLTTLTGAFTVFKNYWSSGTYGDDDKGLHDKYVDPQFVGPTNVSALTWDTANGGAGTIASVVAACCKVSGWDSSGNLASLNPSYSVENYLAYIRAAYTPRNQALKAAGSPVDGSPDIGAVPVAGGLTGFVGHGQGNFIY